MCSWAANTNLIPQIQLMHNTLSRNCIKKKFTQNLISPAFLNFWSVYSSSALSHGNYRRIIVFLIYHLIHVSFNICSFFKAAKLIIRGNRSAPLVLNRIRKKMLHPKGQNQ